MSPAHCLVSPRHGKAHAKPGSRTKVSGLAVTLVLEGFRGSEGVTGNGIKVWVASSYRVD